MGPGNIHNIILWAAFEWVLLVVVDGNELLLLITNLILENGVLCTYKKRVGDCYGLIIELMRIFGICFNNCVWLFLR